MAVRAIVTVPATAKVGEVIEVRALIQHPMETGYRVGSDGVPLKRDLVRRIDARFEGEPVWSAELHAAIAANPYFAFTLRVPGSGSLVLEWQGDNGFAHRESVRIHVA